MPPLVRQLDKDHYQLIRILNCLDFEIRHYKWELGRPAHLPIILDALDYIQTYPEKCHHPLEDILFAHLAKKCPEAAEVIDDLTQDHLLLEELTVDLVNDFMTVAQGQVVPSEQLVRKFTVYNREQRNHLFRESTEVFPLLESHFDEQDWQEVMAQLQAIKDPVFGPYIQEDYQSLYDYIMALEEEDKVA